MAGFRQVVSAGGDGLVKVWTIKTGECDTTLDNHTDRIWSLALNEEENTLVSGGGDSVITFWEDTTALEKEKQAQALEVRVEKSPPVMWWLELTFREQDLANYVQRKDWRNAIITAMELDQPYRLLNLFNEVISNSSVESGKSITGLAEVDQVIATLSDEQLTKLLLRVRDWSTNARTSHVAQRILHVILRKCSPDRLMGLKDIKGVVEALIPYSDRYLKQVDKLLQESYVVDYILREMDDLQTDMIDS
jgi:U3 small nucleolar RNA-associated protein 13